jgi:hypothetical protein
MVVMPVKITAVDPAALRASSAVAAEDIPEEVGQHVRDMVEHNEDNPKDLIHLEFDSAEEKAEWKVFATAFAAQNNIRLRESGIRGKSDNEGYFRAFDMSDPE